MERETRFQSRPDVYVSRALRCEDGAETEIAQGKGVEMAEDTQVRTYEPPEEFARRRT